MEKYDIYGGEVELRFYESDHEYKVRREGVEGLEKVPSTSSITDVLAKPGLRYWAVSETLKYLERELEPGVPYDEVELKGLLSDAKKARFKPRDKGGNIGSVVHDWIEKYVKMHISDGEDPVAVEAGAGTEEDHIMPAPHNKEAKTALRSFLSWEMDHDITWLESEMRVYSRSRHYAGTFDALAMIDGKLTIIDFKTSKGLYDSHYLQIAGYAAAYEEMSNGLVDQALLLRIPKVEEQIETKMLSRKMLEDHVDGFLGALKLHEWNDSM